MNQFKSNLPTNDKGSSSGKQNAHTNPMAPHINSMALQTKRRRKGTNKIQTRISSNQQ